MSLDRVDLWFGTNGQATLTRADAMEITGFKAGNLPQATAPSGPKLLVGEKLSICGKFAISSAGQWRELSAEECVSKVPEIGGVTPEGKPIPNSVS